LKYFPNSIPNLEVNTVNVREMMSQNVACCEPDTPLTGVAQLMVEKDCGAIPVVDGLESMRLVGMITDRDITTRTVAEGRNPTDLRAKDCMTLGVATVTEEADLRKVCETMESKKVRRLPVVSADGVCVGIVSQADVAQVAPDSHVAELLRELSAHRIPARAPLII
jgi:CBS domain-containing protein